MDLTSFVATLKMANIFSIFGAPFFIVWRESVEALLVIGILYSWLRKENLLFLTNRLWLGTGLGLFVAGLLALAFWFAGNWFAGSGGEWFFTGMMLVASLLILQMVVWMHRHGRGLKGELEREAAASIKNSGGFGIMLIAMLAVAREGSETVVFLAGVGAQQQGASLGYFILDGTLGFIFALVSFWALQKSAKIISWKYFFLLSEFVLLLIGGGLLVTAFDKAAMQLSAYDLPDWAYNFMDNPVWSSNWLLSDNSTLTGLTGYHAEPSMLQIFVLAIYWVLAITLCVLGNKNKRQQARHNQSQPDQIQSQIKG